MKSFLTAAKAHVARCKSNVTHLLPNTQLRVVIGNEVGEITFLESNRFTFNIVCCSLHLHRREMQIQSFPASYTHVYLIH